MRNQEVNSLTTCIWLYFCEFYNDVWKNFALGPIEWIFLVKDGYLANYFQ